VGHVQAAVTFGAANHTLNGSAVRVGSGCRARRLPSAASGFSAGRVASLGRASAGTGLGTAMLLKGGPSKGLGGAFFSWKRGPGRPASALHWMHSDHKPGMILGGSRIASTAHSPFDLPPHRQQGLPVGWRRCATTHGGYPNHRFWFLTSTNYHHPDPEPDGARLAIACVSDLPKRSLIRFNSTLPEARSNQGLDARAGLGAINANRS